MEPFLPYLPHLTAMLVLLVGSAFFSSSEAALFYLSREDQDVLARGRPAQRMATQLLATPERLLTSILFWNLVINIAYFALATQIGISLERRDYSHQAGMFAVGSLLAIILFSEMLPKNLAVLWPRGVSTAVSLPLTAATHLLSPLIPTLQTINRISLRTIMPDFQREAYLELRDIERAILLSTPDKSLAREEETVLQQIVSLSEIEAVELMRPRLSLNFYKQPVALDDLRANPPTGNHLLVAEPDSDELDRALDLRQLANLPESNLEAHCKPVAFVPWCASGAATLDLLRRSPNGIAGVVNEHGETIGVVTFEDLLHLLFASAATQPGTRAASLAIVPVDNAAWELSGAVTLRRLAKQLQLDLPATRSVTVAGILQEQLQRLPQQGDEIAWGNCRWVVVDSPRPGQLTVRIELLSATAADGDTSEQGEGI